MEWVPVIENSHDKIWQQENQTGLWNKDFRGKEKPAYKMNTNETSEDSKTSKKKNQSKKKKYINMI